MEPIFYILGAVATVLGSGGFSAVIIKHLNQPIDTATADKLRAETRQTAQVTTAAEVQTIRAVLKEVREGQAAKDQQNAADLAELRADVRGLKQSVSVLEERERHMLTRAAVHEAWDQLAFQRIIADDHGFPSPPPLSIDPSNDN